MSSLILAVMLYAALPGSLPGDTIRVAFVPPPRSDEAQFSAATRGAAMAAQEAERTAALLRRSFELLTLSAKPDVLERELARIAAEGVLTVVGGYDSTTCAALAKASAQHGLLFFNVGCTGEYFRGDGCARGAFHVAMSDGMREEVRASTAQPGVVVAEWHPDLVRYGARQVNDRFESLYGGAMDARAWTTWLAVKIASEAGLRLGGEASAASLLAYVADPHTRFDGHKGMPLSFRPWDHQLRQPLVLIDPATGEMSGTFPDEDGSEAASPTALLDRIGNDASETACRMNLP